MSDLLDGVRSIPVSSFEFLKDQIAGLPSGIRCDCYRPILFRLLTPDVLPRLLEGISGLSRLEIVDTVDNQLAELARIHHPRRKLTIAEVQAYSDVIKQGRSAGEYGTWVYYPWTSRLVHVLEEAHFIELRTNRNLYKITADERDALAGKRVGVVGLSAGQPIALTLAMERGFGEIRLADFDTLDLSNLNRLRSPVHNVALPKVFVTAREIMEIDPYLQLRCFTQGIHEGNIEAFLLENGKLDLLVEECDSIDAKFLLREMARYHRIPVLMQTSDRGHLDIERYDVEPERPLFHGLAGDLIYRNLADLSFEERVPYVLKILGTDALSPRSRASMLEIEQSLTTWPQLASSVALGGAVGADTARRLMLGEDIASGRYYVDLDALIPDRAVYQASQSNKTMANDARPLTPFTVEVLPPINGALQVLGRDVIIDLVTAGTKAPSGGNVQPWRWWSKGDTLYLTRDVSRESPWLAVDGLSTYLALGAAAENVVLRAQALGLEVRLDVPGCLGEESFVAAFRFLAHPQDEVSVEPRLFPELAAQIPDRHTNRQVTSREAVSKDALRNLTRAAHSVPRVAVHFITSPEDLLTLRDMLGQVMRVIMLNEQSHASLMSEIRWGEDSAGANADGIDLPSLCLRPIDRAGLEVCRDWRVLNLLRQWNLGNGLTRLAERSLDAAACAGLITVPDWSPRTFFDAGRAMQRLWLTSTAQGLGLQPWSVLPYMYARAFVHDNAGLDAEQVDLLARIWPRYRALFGVDETRGQALLFRLCVAPPSPARSGRRDISDVLTFQ